MPDYDFLKHLKKQFGPKGGEHQWSSFRRRWATTTQVSAIHYVVEWDEHLEWDDNEHGREDFGPTHLLLLTGNQSGTHPMYGINLTSFTEEELVGFKETIVKALDEAIEVTRTRDEQAMNRAQNDEDHKVHERVYRPVPIVVDKKRVQPQHGESVQG